MRIRTDRVIAQTRQQWMGALALFLVLTGGVAYAADTVGSPDVINESLLSEDIKNNEVKTTDLAQNSVQTGKIGNDQVFSEDVRDDTLPNGGLSGADIDEATLGSVPSADQVDGASFTVNRTNVINPRGTANVLDLAGIGKLSARCSSGGTSFTLTYTNQSDGAQQQIADQRSQDGTEATLGNVLVSGGTTTFSFPSNSPSNQGHRLMLQVAPSAATFPDTVALTTFYVTGLTRGGGANACRFQGTATVQ